ncbi:MAG: adenosylmethionine--8-amino-7-oxononanoate transaminase [Planctomycetota bacterium]|nr:adenosylmethionine--8-amino-7-oxononanoate transaminase [Planctomycetota bacterium]MDA1139929.1 adenosylmethionine--8-amino-7-oxononanoate transaminase [Planctomycetota bacterium]
MPNSTQLDKQYVWHPFTQMQDWMQNDVLVIESGHGVMLRDTEGREYIDGVSSLWCNVHGHQHPRLNQAIRDQAAKIAHSTLLGLGSEPAAKLAARLVEILPEGLTHVFYSDSGATACEVAIKMAFQYWQQCSPPHPSKTKYVALPNAYHGDTLGAVSVGGVELFHKIFRPLLFEALRAPSPYVTPPAGVSPGEHLKKCVDGLDAIFRENGHEIAAMILEPLVQGAAGMLMAPPGYLKAVRELCTRYDILMIVDEVATGFGRTGKMFACEHEGITPDLLALGKGLTGGYLPVAATVANDKVFSAFLGEYSDFRTFFHGHTFTGNALGCAVGLASLDVFEEEKVLENLRPKMSLLGRRLQEEFKPHPNVAEIRQCGFIGAVDLVKGREPREEFPSDRQMGMKVCVAARNHGILIRPLRNTLVIMPPLSISEDELHRLLDGILVAMADTLR